MYIIMKMNMTFNDFEKLILIGLKNGAPKGTKMVFGTGGGKLSLQVNGRGIGCGRIERITRDHGKKKMAHVQRSAR